MSFRLCNNNITACIFTILNDNRQPSSSEEHKQVLSLTVRVSAGGCVVRVETESIKQQTSLFHSIYQLKTKSALSSTQRT